LTHLIAAVAAVAAALLELAVVHPYLAIGGAAPHPVLVFGIVWAIAVGFEEGLTWAFIGGLALDVLAQRPLGSTAFALLVCLGAATVLAGLLPRARIAVPILAAFLLSFVYSMTIHAAYVALQGPLLLEDPLGTLLPSAVYDAVLAAVAGPLAVALIVRRREAEWVER
jgi:rod shape-determining protein MreD